MNNFYDVPGLTDHLMGTVITCLRLLPALALPFRQMEAKMADLGHRMQHPGGDPETHQMVTTGCEVLSPMMFQNVPDCMQNVPECIENVPECMQNVHE